MSRAAESNRQTAQSTSSPERRAYYERIGGQHLAPLWEVLFQILVKEPKTAALPHCWRYDTVRPLLLEAAELISAEEAERRVLVLENPGLRGKTALTETLYAGLQIIMPGEVAPAHRHTPSALRFIVEGAGAYTAVDGERAEMSPGDLILTPSWCWHDHGHEGNDPVVWLDGLDIPLLNYLGPIFTELYPEACFPPGRAQGDTLARYAAGMVPLDAAPSSASPLFHYPYARTREALLRVAQSAPPDPCHGIVMAYVNPVTGAPVMPTLSAFLQYLPKQFAGSRYRTTAAFCYSVIEGTGHTRVGDQVLEWGPRDTFVVPMWQPHSHNAQDDAVLFCFSDRGMQQQLGLWREQRDVPTT